MKAAAVGLLLLIMCAVSATAQVTVTGISTAATAPSEVTVTRAFPENGAKDVDPKLAYIRVRFRAPVDTSGWSFVNTDYGKPVKSTGKPKFEDGGKLVLLPVKLEPGTTYSVSINSESYTGFRSAGNLKVTVTPYLLTFTTSGKAPTKAELSSPEKWREDLAYLAETLPAKHKNLFFSLTEGQWKQKVAELDKQIPKLREDQILVGFEKLVASVGDEHTGIDVSPAGLSYLPMGFYWFKDGIYVVAASEEYKKALGCRVEKIGNVPVDKACLELATLVAHANDAQVKKTAPFLLSVAENLTGSGLVEDAKKIPIEVRGSDGETLKLEMAPLRNRGAKMIPAYDVSKNPPLYLTHPREPYWADYLADKDTVYFQYDTCRSSPDNPFGQFQAGLQKLIGEHPSARLVIDLRENGGGNSAILDPFITWLKDNKEANRRGKLFVIVGRRTFSSAILNALRLRNETHAILAGEPTGGSPNHYGEVQTFKLPNSGFTVSYSTKYFTYSDKDEPTITPEILVELTSQDYFSGRDPVVDAINNYRGK